jgi:AraC-like DNA-binding protein
MSASIAKHSATVGTVRIAPVASIPRVLEELGFDAAAVLADCDFDIRLFDDPDTVIPYSVRTRLLQQCAEKTGCRHFGHLTARHTGPSAYGIAGFLMQQSPDVATALRSFVRYSHLHVSGAVVYLDEGPETSFLGYSILGSTYQESEQLADGAITAAFNIMRGLCGANWQPTQVCFAHRKPSNLRPFKQYFNAPLVHNAERNGLEFASSWLPIALKSADPDLRLLLQRQIDQLENRYSDNFAEQVRRVLRSAVLMHQATAAHVADLFSIHERTLNRRLREYGTCFRELLNETRFDLARQLLAESSMSLTDIAAVLEYSDVSAFARAFRRQSGTAPSAWREKHLQGKA